MRWCKMLSLLVLSWIWFHLKSLFVRNSAHLNFRKKAIHEKVISAEISTYIYARISVRKISLKLLRSVMYLTTASYIGWALRWFPSMYWRFALLVNFTKLLKVWSVSYVIRKFRLLLPLVLISYYRSAIAIEYI